MIKLDDALNGVASLGLETPPVIYFVEANPTYDSLVTELFQRIADGRLEGYTSVVSLTEVLVHPIHLNQPALREAYRDLLLGSDHMHVLPITPEIAEGAAELRAVHNLRTPDALQIAAALDAGCEAFLTNDSTLRRVTDLRVLVLDDLEL